MTCSYSHYLIRRSTTLNTELANPAGVYRMSWSLTLALGMSPSIPVCPLHQLVCTGQALLWFSVRGMAGCGRAVPHWNTAGSLDTDKWDGRSVNSCVIEKQIKEVLGLCQSEVGGVFCLSSLSVGSVLVTVLRLTGGPSSCLQFLSDVWLQKKTLKLSFLTWPWWEQDRNNTSVVFLYFYSDYFTLAWQDGAGASRWGLSAREVAPVK